MSDFRILPRLDLKESWSVRSVPVGLPYDTTIWKEDFLAPGRYEIQRLLRSAPDKNVYFARDRVLDCQVVVDVFSNNATMPNGLTVSAWETSMLGQLDDHRNIATVLDHWEDDERRLWSLATSPAEACMTSSRTRRESAEGLPVESILQDRDRNRERTRAYPWTPHLVPRSAAPQRAVR